MWPAKEEVLCIIVLALSAAAAAAAGEVSESESALQIQGGAREVGVRHLLLPRSETSTSTTGRFSNMVMIEFPAGADCNAQQVVIDYLTAKHIQFKPRTYVNTRLYCAASFELLNTPNGKTYVCVYCFLSLIYGMYVDLSSLIAISVVQDIPGAIAVHPIHARLPMELRHRHSGPTAK